MTIVTPTQRIDLHVHSKYAGRFKLFVLNSLEVEECYTEPEDLYQTMMQRGMSMVTITDHDAIDGCLEIAHHGDHVFISEEVSARFPENGCIVHVCCYGITEAQHDELQRLRYNIYELVDYIREQDILHSLAHPFSPVNQRLTPDLLKKSLLLFDTIEVINGQKDSGHERFNREVIGKVDQPMLERWANEFKIDVAPNRTWKFTAGSDDHSGHTMARSFVEFEGEANLASLRKAIESAEVRVNGFEKTCKSYAHTAAIGTIQYFRHASVQQESNKPGVFHKLVDIIQNQDLPDDPAELPPALQRLIPAAMQTLAEMDSFPDFKKLLANGHKPETHDEIYSLVQTSLLRAFRSSTDAMKEAVDSVDLEPLIDELPTLIRLTLLNLPYYFGIRFFYGERRRARGLYESLELPRPIGQGQRVAILCDTLDNVDGLSINLRRLVSEMRDDGKEVFLCGAKSDGFEPSVDDANVVRFPSIASFPLLGYESYELGWPSLLEVVRWMDENEIDLIVATTPGPVGLIGMMAARLLDTPVIGQYHTNVPEYAFRIIGDRTIGRIVQAYTAWFYNQMEEVLAPTYATREVMSGNGIQSGKVTIVPRGVDSQRFVPALAKADFWTSRGLQDKRTLVYVGRVSLEKNLPFLAKLFKHLVDEHGLDIQLGIVGEGPYLEKMKEELEGYPVCFTGYLQGDELAASYASSDVMMFPSTTDTFGNVVLESMACGTPALVSDVGGPSEIVHHNETGIVLPAGQLNRWADAVVRLMGDDARLERMSGNARTYAESCTFEVARAKTWEFYSKHIDTYRERVRADAY
ncbi:MAG: glycosyltransferase [Nannocystaceae bacterium]|nr:glycosyltransferase [bacterium]